MIRIFSFSFWGSTEKTTETRLSWVSSRCHCVYVLLVAFSVFKDSLKKKKKKKRGSTEGGGRDSWKSKEEGERERRLSKESEWQIRRKKTSLYQRRHSLPCAVDGCVARTSSIERKGGRSDLLWLCVHTRGCVHIIGGCCLVCECAK